ncbi:MAG: 4-hydroxy-tetrahydrodipicolinate reductase [Candidatus Eremiobacteraeota bacterium]|nr:4-hydroxy-tetrahydrodipicolinate reductase [Candidatus Eremiobacteraeota bacterium]
MTRVAVSGALGRMGALACETIRNAPDLELVGGFARAANPAADLYDDIGELFERTQPDVVLDFTTHPMTINVARIALEAGVFPVIGSSGWSVDDREILESQVVVSRLGALLVPNFAIGAVLMMRFAQAAAPFFPSVEIIEMHHDGKRDKPSGTATLTAERIAAARGEGGVPIHSVRLKGLVAHQEVLFGNVGETLTIRHDSLSRESFVAGILLAIRSVGSLRGLVVGLDNLLNGSA